MSAAVIFCEWRLKKIYGKYELDQDADRTTKKFQPLPRAIHIFESLLTAFSDQQIISGLSLLIVAGHSGCEISAYIYNIVCFLLVMNLITHLNALTNTPSWFGPKYQSLCRALVNALLRLILVIVVLILSGIMLGARTGVPFPSDAGVMATFPAACFENANSLQGVDAFISFAQNNTVATMDNGFPQYLTLVIDLFVIIPIMILAALKSLRRRPTGCRMCLSLSLRTLTTSVTTAVLIWLTIGYINQRKTMELSQWYVPDPTADQYTYLDVVTWALLASSVITFVNAFTGKFYSFRVTW